MALTVRRLTEPDVPALLDLVDALLEYEQLPRPDPGARDRLAADALANSPHFHVLLAELEGEIVGYALYMYTYSTLLGRPTLYLEDLFVRPDRRGAGAGAALFRACVSEAVRQGCGRMDWQVLNWNTPAIEFYRRLGAEQLTAWLPFRLEGAALERLGQADWPVDEFPTHVGGTSPG